MKHRLTAAFAPILAIMILISNCSKSTEPEPELGKIIYSHDPQDASADIYRMNYDGTGVEQILATETQCDYPSCSPDGEKIAYCQYIVDEDHIFVMNADGSNNYQLTFTDSSEADSLISHYMPRWSPDGSQIVFSRTYFPTGVGNSDLYIMNEDGSNLHKLYGEDNFSEAYASWSPDGSKILFESYVNGGGLYTINPDGTGLATIIEGEGTYKEPCWSPDGSKIACTYKSHSEQEWIWQILILNADGSNPVNISNNSFSERQPIWTEDGEKIIFVTNEVDEFNKEIFSMNCDGSNRINLTNSSATDKSPALLY